MPSKPLVIVALSGGVDSAVAALLLQREGYAVECLHMTNWEDDDGYCQAASDLQDARRVADQLRLKLHRVNFSREYHERVFEDFLAEYRAGRTPNPDVLCNRHIKFGVLKDYARRLGAGLLATGHYVRLATDQGKPRLFKGSDPTKDQSYFLHSVSRTALENVLFPLGSRTKREVRRIAGEAALAVSRKRDSTGICFNGERPFAGFLGRYIQGTPGDIVTETGDCLGTHRGLPFYTLGQRQGLGIGGSCAHGAEPWYVAAKDCAHNQLIVVQGGDHPSLFTNWLKATDSNWLAEVSNELTAGGLRCSAKTRYRQADQNCRVRQPQDSVVEVCFDEPQRSVTAGQYVVFYAGDCCLGGAKIEQTGWQEPSSVAAIQVQ
jgi:tRNA-specific 2-thiouridylase